MEKWKDGNMEKEFKIKTYTKKELALMYREPSTTSRETSHELD